MITKPTGSARWDEKKENGGWKDRMDDWKMQQHGNLGPHEADDSADADMAMYVDVYILLARVDLYIHISLPGNKRTIKTTKY